MPKKKQEAPKELCAVINTSVYGHVLSTVQIRNLCPGDIGIIDVDHAKILIERSFKGQLEYADMDELNGPFKLGQVFKGEPIEPIVIEIDEDSDADEESEDEGTEETPAEETPAEETPAEETPAEETPAEETPAEETPAEETPKGRRGRNNDK